MGGDGPFLERPADEDLRGVAPVLRRESRGQHREHERVGEAESGAYLARDGLDRGMSHLAADDGTVRLDDDRVLRAVLDDHLLLQERMQLDGARRQRKGRDAFVCERRGSGRASIWFTEGGS